MADVCIICQKEIKPKDASKIKEDRVISFIRSVKNLLKVAKNNKLFVCKTDMEEYKKRRKQFEKDVLIYGILGVGIIVVFSGMPLLVGNFNFVYLLISIFMGAAVFLFGTMAKYVPALAEK